MKPIVRPNYLPRIVDSQVRDVLSYSGGLLIEGVRACGKTATARQVCASSIELDATSPELAALSQTHPSLLLDGAAPRLIDEWQLVPQLWNLVRRRIDDSESKGLFVLTGSSVPSEDAMRHSGAHRISRLRLRTMTLAERGLSRGIVSLAALFDGEPAPVDLGVVPELPDVLDDLVHGGWPSDLDISADQAARHLRDYARDLVNTDVERLAGAARRDTERMYGVLRSLARNTGTEAKYSTVAKDASAAVEVSAETVSKYVSVLERLFVLERQPAWGPHLRSKERVRTSDKLHFVDPALPLAILDVSADRLMHDLQTAGFFFESWVCQQLRVYVEALDGQIYHYRDASGREIDIILQLSDGRWAAIEVKLGYPQIPVAVKSLRSFLARVDTTKMGQPEFMAVITSNGHCAPLGDGMQTFPIHALTL